MKRGTRFERALRAARDQSRARASQERAISVRGASGDPARGSYCTPRYVAEALPTFDLDAFSNDRSHIRARVSLALERGEDGYGNGEAGTFKARRSESLSRLASCALHTDLGEYAIRRATSTTRVWIQPDYTDVLRACRHYLHTRFVALLRFDPRPEWADLIGGASEWIGVLSNSPGRSSFEFEAPPSVTASSNTFPHALYARRYEDVTQGMKALCSYPDGTARHWRKRSALDGPGAARWISQWGLDASLFPQTAP